MKKIALALLAIVSVAAHAESAAVAARGELV
jgi:hypothetical protein